MGMTRLRASLLPERPHELVVQRLHQIGQHGAVAGLDEGFRRHAGDQPGVTELGDLLCRQRDADGVVALAGALVGGDVGRDAADDAVELRRGALVESGQAQQRLLTDLELVDIDRIDLGLDLEIVGLRPDQHEGVAGGDDAPNRMHGRLQHHAVLRRADVDAAQLVLGGDLALDHFADLVVGLAQILGDLADHVLVDLDDLELGLGDLAFGLRARGDVLRALAVEAGAGARRGGAGGVLVPALAVEAGAVAFERGQAGDLHQVLVIEIPHTDELLLHQRDFPVLGSLLRGEALDLLVELLDALAQLRLLAGASVDANVEQLGFGGEQRLDVGIVAAIEQRLRVVDPVNPALLGLEPRGTRLRRVEILGDDGEVGLGDGVVEPHHDVAGLDHVAIARTHLADHAAGRMLHLFDIGPDDDLTRRDQRARNLHRPSPAAEADQEDQHDPKPEHQVKPDRLPYGPLRGRLRAAERHRAHALAPPSLTILIGAGAVTRGWSTWASTCSFGPKACMRPSRSTRIWSTASTPIGRCATTMTMAPRSRAARMARVRASSPSVSRLELGSSSTIRNGLP